MRKLISHKLSKDVQLSGVGSVLTNLGVKRFCEKSDIPFKIGNVGIKNLYEKAE